MQSHPSHQRPLWLGALIAPLAAPFAAAPLATLLAPPIYGSFLQALILFPVVAIVAIVYGYVGMAVTGLPLAILLRRYGLLSSALLCSVSMPLGATLWLIARSFATEPVQLEQAPMEALVGGGVSLLIAMLFCAVSGITVVSRR